MNKLRLCSIFILLACLFGFALVSPARADLIDHPWTGYGTGATTVVSDGEFSPAKFTYDSWGTYWGEWTFETEAEADGTHVLLWNYQGLHAWFMVTVGLDAFITHEGATTTVNLVNAGPANCCTPPSNGFNYFGTFTFDVQSGDTYGFKMRGSNFDLNWLLRGTLTVDDHFIHNDLFYFNGNYYELFNFPGLSWENARDFANTLELEGCYASHLVTITSPEEQEALYGHFSNSLEYKYYGGYQPEPGPDPAAGWVWITGEEWIYTNWGVGQPDDWQGGEHYLLGWYNGTWNDDKTAPGFLVEYECNQPPVADAGGPYVGDEGSPISLDGSGSSDPDGDLLTYDWTVDPAPCTFDDPDVASPSLTCSDNGDFNVTLTVNDGLKEASAAVIVTVSNVAPTVSIDSVDAALVLVGTPATVGGSFTDPGASDTFTAEWDWGDGSASSGSVNGMMVGPDTHTYLEAGIYQVQLTVVDDDTGSGSAQYQYIVVYDPSGGFVSGGGWIESPAGAYTPDPTLTGKATFGFVSKYQKGSDTPTGNTEFQFHVAGFNFHSTSYDWLVVTGSDYARFKGEGTINSEGAYKFMIWAGDETGTDGADTFRIKIWTEDEFGNETIIYDNGFDQAIANGSIIVHASR